MSLFKQQVHSVRECARERLHVCVCREKCLLNFIFVASRSKRRGDFCQTRINVTVWDSAQVAVTVIIIKHLCQKSSLLHFQIDALERFSVMLLFQTVARICVGLCRIISTGGDETVKNTDDQLLFDRCCYCLIETALFPDVMPTKDNWLLAVTSYVAVALK